jgi:hypothetical protein
LCRTTRSIGSLLITTFTTSWGEASIAGAIVTSTLFMLGASFLLGGLKHHVQEFNRVGARMQARLLFLATIALLIPSAVSEADAATASGFARKLSLGLAPPATQTKETNKWSLDVSVYGLAVGMSGDIRIGPDNADISARFDKIWDELGALGAVRWLWPSGSYRRHGALCGQNAPPMSTGVTPVAQTGSCTKLNEWQRRPF